MEKLIKMIVGSIAFVALSFILTGCGSGNSKSSSNTVKHSSVLTEKINVNAMDIKVKTKGTSGFGNAQLVYKGIPVSEEKKRVKNGDSIKANSKSIVKMLNNSSNTKYSMKNSTISVKVSGMESPYRKTSSIKNMDDVLKKEMVSFSGRMYKGSVNGFIGFMMTADSKGIYFLTDNDGSSVFTGKKVVKVEGFDQEAKLDNDKIVNLDLDSEIDENTLVTNHGYVYKTLKDAAYQSNRPDVYIYLTDKGEQYREDN